MKRIWNAECNNEETHILQMEEFNRINEVFNQKERAFLKRLNEEDKFAFDEIISKYLELLHPLLMDAYSKGIKLGGQMISKILKK